MTLDSNDCSPNPCINGGICHDGFFNYSCACPSGFTGNRCQYQTYNLWVYARYGRNLPDADDGLSEGDSDPYMQFIAYDIFGNGLIGTTRYIQDNKNPTWYQWFYFGNRAWTKMTVSVHDADIGLDDALSGTSTYYLYKGYYYRKIYCYSGHAYFDYYIN